ncbi:MAG: hypothetical protein WDN69_11105 [Aliidongia sp.]
MMIAFSAVDPDARHGLRGDHHGADRNRPEQRACAELVTTARNRQRTEQQIVQQRQHEQHGHVLGNREQRRKIKRHGRDSGLGAGKGARVRA